MRHIYPEWLREVGGKACCEREQRREPPARKCGAATGRKLESILETVTQGLVHLGLSQTSPNLVSLP